MTKYRLLSSGLVYTPGILAWAMNGYGFKDDRPQILSIMTGTFPDVPEDKMHNLLLGKIPYQIEDEAVVFECP